MSKETIKRYLQLNEQKQTRRVKRKKKEIRLRVVQKLRLQLLAIRGYAIVMDTNEIQDELHRALRLLEREKEI